jgi:molybdate transport system ATP-binding protein
MPFCISIKKKLSGFELDIKLETKADMIGISGISGSGKTMILRCIAGLVKPDEGRIIVDGRTLFDSEKKINLRPGKRKVGFVFQNYALFPHLTIYDNIAFGLDFLSRQEKRI